MLVPLAAPPRTRLVAPGFHGHLLPTETFDAHEWWLLHLYRYEGELIVDGTAFDLRPGYASLIPPGSTTEYHFTGNSMHLYACLDIHPPGDPDGQQEIPIVQDLGDRFGRWWSAVEDAVSYWFRQPARVNALFWQLLWELAEPRPNPSADPALWHHPALWRALYYIGLHFPEPITVADIAHHAGISPRQLRDLFHRGTGMTVIGYLRAWRVAEAVKLLTRTERPIKAIAAAVGIPDLHAFNKTIRELTGKPPRAHRHPTDHP